MKRISSLLIGALMVLGIASTSTLAAPGGHSLAGLQSVYGKTRSTGQAHWYCPHWMHCGCRIVCGPYGSNCRRVCH